MTKKQLLEQSKTGDKLLVIIKRMVFSTKSTISDLYVNGILFCNILEDFDRGLHQWMSIAEIESAKVYGKTAIPRGMYHCKMTMSNRFKKMMPEILGVPGFAGARMHAGNDADDTDGCTLFGDYNPKHPNWVSNSTARKNEFYALVNAVGGEFDLVIC